MAAALAVIWLLTLDAAGLGRSLSVTGIQGGPAGVVEVLDEATRRFRSRPIDTWDFEDALGALTRYALECTLPSDRLLVTWFAPQVFFYAERPFAGGQVYLHPGWHASDADQRVTVERLERQRVPILRTNTTEPERFAQSFPIVHDYVMRHYETTMPAVSTGPFSVLVDPRIGPTGVHDPTGLPCYL